MHGYAQDSKYWDSESCCRYNFKWIPSVFKKGNKSSKSSGSSATAYTFQLIENLIVLLYWQYNKKNTEMGYRAACISILNNKQQDIIQTKSEEFSVCYIHDVINTVNQPWNHRLKTWCTRTCALTLDTTKSVEKKQGQRSHFDWLKVVEWKHAW